jgi:thiosulfate dehydrogenase
MTQIRGMGGAIVVCAAIGAIIIAATISFGHPSIIARAPGANEEYGKRLMIQTTEYLGPDVADPRMRFSKSRLACASCHIDAGAEPGELSLIGAIERYPKIIDRINRCMTGNMNGRPLPAASPEMAALISWLHFLADRDAATGASEREPHDPQALRIPGRAADPGAGEKVFEKRCADCHGTDGAGLPATRRIVDGYLFPPLWGPNSFNSAAEMADPALAAKFIKAKMPLGQPDLDNDQAFDVAAFITTKPRPHK